MENKYDFSGWATRNDLQCSDGRIIRRDAFKHNDGMTVPLVWNHDHADPYRIVGHALLENRDEGVYTYGSFNDTELGRTAKTYVQHGDITSLSIYANQLKQQGPNVMHGSIREVSLVLAGANPGAYIENVLKHGDEMDDEARIFTGYDIELYHADADEDKKEEKEDEKMAEETKKTEEVKSTEEAKKNTSEDDETIEEIIEGLSDKQQKAVYALVGMVVEEFENKEKDVKHSDEDYEGGNDTMKHNVFDSADMTEKDNVLSHSEMKAILDEAYAHKGSLKETMLAHGIEDIEILFPDHKTLNNEPEFIRRDDTWVADVLGGVHHTPFSRVKSIFADITADEARAKGYIKGNKKVEEVFKLLKRVTNPTTIYKKQKIDRDDMLDITDFNFLAWLKKEIRIMFNEELARAILVGDGRTALSADKINEENIRPIWTDEDLYTVKAIVETTDAMTADERAREFIKACIKSRKEYKGSGNPSMFMSEDMLTDCLLIEDKNGRIIYDSVEKLAARLRVRRIIPVPVMENLTREVEGTVHTLAGIYVNLVDYNVGTDKGGELNFFDDFDIDYNQMKYLMEGRCSGALTKPHSAVVVEFVPAASAG